MRYKKSSKKKPLLLALAALLLIGAVLAILELTDVINLYSRKQNSSDSSNGINLGPPTEEEQQAGDDKKDEIIESENHQNSDDETSAKTAHVIITDAAQYSDVIEVRSFINDHYEDGTCTITFTQGSQTVSKDTPAYRDASTTICTNPLFQRSEFPASGNWQVIVTYKASGASGQSEPQTVKIE